MMNTKVDISAPSLLLSGVDYFKTAVCLDASKPWQVYPQIYMYCLSIELGLKAFLRAKGKTEKELIKYGHRLDKLFSDAREHHLGFENSEIINDFIIIFNELYNKGGLRYINEGGIISLRIKSHSKLRESIKKFYYKIYPQCYRSIGDYKAILLKHHLANFKKELEA